MTVHSVGVFTVLPPRRCCEDEWKEAGLSGWLDVGVLRPGNM